MTSQPLGCSSTQPTHRRTWWMIPLLLILLSSSWVVGCICLDVARGTSYSARLVPLTAPLLERWLEARDTRLHDYAHRTLRDAPFPYSTRWLEHEMARPDSEVSAKYVTQHADHFGLGRVEVQLRLSGLAMQHRKQHRVFHRDFLEGLAAGDPSDAWWDFMVAEVERYPDDLWFYVGLLDNSRLPPRLRPRLGELRKLAQRECVLEDRSRLEPDAQAALALLEAGATPAVAFEGVSSDARCQLARQLAKEFDQLPQARAALELLADEGKQPEAYRAAEELLLHGDRGRIARYTDRDLQLMAKSLENREFQILYLIAIAEAFPESRFARGCRSYGQIRDQNYFGSRWHEQAYGHRPVEEERGFRAWLEQYPDHPGADDARYGLIRSLEWQGRRLEALRFAWSWRDEPGGDADMLEPIRMRCLFLLDAGTSLDELEAFAAEAHHPAVTYALAVRLARRHGYAEALQLTEGLVFPADFMVRPWGDEHNLDEDLRKQRQRWQKLANLNTYQRAREWAREDGWRIGYLNLYRGRRVWTLDMVGVDWGKMPRPDQALLREELHRANHHAVAIDLFDQCQGAEAMFSPVMLMEYQFHACSTAENAALWGDRAGFAAEAERRA
ncbi:MAG: hypothetical protein KC910_15770, partial [Candidatus Eremiobacteraeota bacterium]|nr:hypothetical protein [Candidatus Eremiobacteraeota bacterium]